MKTYKVYLTTTQSIIVESEVEDIEQFYKKLVTDGYVRNKNSIRRLTEFFSGVEDYEEPKKPIKRFEKNDDILAF